MAKLSPLHSGTRLIDGDEKVGFTVSRGFQAFLNQIEALNVKVGSDQFGVHIDDDGVVRIGDGTDNYVQFDTDGTQTMVGTARKYRHVRVGAGSWKGGVSAPAAGFIAIFPTIDFDTASDDESHYSVLVPYRFESGSTINFAIDWTYEGVQDNGTVCWGIEYICLGDGDTVDGSTTTSLETTAGSHTTGTMIRTIFTTGITGAHAHDVLAVRVYRDVSGDDLAADACLIETHFEFIMNKMGEDT